MYSLGVRDYIHVMDLATGHVAALRQLRKQHQRLKASVTGMFLFLSCLPFLISSSFINAFAICRFSLFHFNQLVLVSAAVIRVIDF